jgi:hypothetical protein
MVERKTSTRKPKAETHEVVDESGPETPELPVTPVTAQFPALDGTDEGLHAEVAKRSPDGSDGNRFEKVFSVGRLGITAEDSCHRQHAIGVVQEAVQRGLHPRGDVFLVDAVETDEPLNASGSRRKQHTDLRYAVEVVPASVDTKPVETTTPTDIHEAE